MRGRPDVWTPDAIGQGDEKRSRMETVQPKINWDRGHEETLQDKERSCPQGEAQNNGKGRGGARRPTSHGR
jgi:hypothetical protein